MFLSEQLYESVQTALRTSVTGQPTILSIQPVSGGDINRAYRIDTDRGSFFLKTTDTAEAMAMFLGESDGLRLIREATSGDSTPSVHTVGHAQGEAFLLMDWVVSTPDQHPRGQEALGRLLASLHRQHTGTFGLAYDNYIGRLRQPNAPTSDWADFFHPAAPRHQLDQVAPEYSVPPLRARFERLYNRLPELFPAEPPALVHGDLWGGNYLIGANDTAVLIDPAVYYAHREVDLAMTRLFGGFTERFYDTYQEHYPLTPGWQSRAALWNLYPLLVHVNLFGPSYLEPIRRTLDHFG